MSLILTRMQNFRAASNLDKNELRPSRYGALDLFMRQSEDPMGILTEDLKTKAENSIGNILETPVVNYDAGITIGNTRTVTIPDSENTSKMVQFTFATYAWGFTIVPALYKNNEIAMQRDFDIKMRKYLYKFAEKMDTDSVAALSAAKTQVFKDALQYPTTGNVLQAKWSERENIIGDINPIMSANDYYTPLHLVGNAGIESMIRKMAEKGLYNEINKQLEYSDKVLHFTNRVANESNQYATAYAVPEGHIGILTRFEREALMRTRARTGHEWDIDTLPMLNFPVGTYYYESVDDYNTIAGAASADMTRNLKQHYGFAVDVCFVTAYNSDPSTLASPIIKLQIAKETATDSPKVFVANPDANPIPTKVIP